MAFLTGWTYRKRISLSRASGAVSNYQMKLLVGESSGASGEDVDCGALCATDFDDLRFTAADGTTLLPYWIEEVTGATPNQLATIWVNFNSIGTGTTYFYMYYGNAGAAAYSNGADTFIAFEDFEWGADGDDINTSGGSITWVITTAGSSTAKISTTQKWNGTRSLKLSRDGSNNVVATALGINAGDDISIRLRIRKDDTSAVIVKQSNGTKRFDYRLEADEDISINNGSSYIDTEANAAVDTWELHELNNFVWATPTMDAWLNSSQIADDYSINNVSSSYTDRIAISNIAGTSDVYIDNLIVTDWLAVEPDWGSWGTQEEHCISSVAIGLVNTNNRDVNILRSSSVAIGLKLTNILTRWVTSKVTIGLSLTQSKLITMSRTSVTPLGLVVSATKLIDILRTSSTAIGLSLTATVTIWYGRAKVWISSVRKTIQGLVRIQKRIEERSTASFVVQDLTASESFQHGQSVEILWGFEKYTGYIDTPEHSPIRGNDSLLHGIACKDQHYLADKRIAAASYENQTCGYVVDDLYDNYLAAEGVSIGLIQDGPTIQEAVINYVRVSDAFNALAEKANFIWFIDEDKALYFMDRTTVAAPWTLTAADILLDSGSVDTSNPLYRNQQYIRGGKALTSLQTETRIGDGTATAFTMGYPLAKAPTVTLNAGAQTVGIKGLDTGKDWYWSKGDSVVTQDSGGTVLETTDSLVIAYYGQYDLIVQSTDYAQVVVRAAIEGGTGIVEDIADDTTVTTEDSGFELAAAKLTKFSTNAKRFPFRTLKEGLEPGQLLTIDYPLLGFNDDELLIESVNITLTESQYIYDVVAIEGPAMGSWSQFFATLANKHVNIDEMSLGSGSTLTILSSTSEQTTWTEDIDETVTTFSAPGAALFPGATVYP